MKWLIKRILSLFVMVTLFVIPTFAVQGKTSIQTNVIAPSWSEFCPEQYVNAERKSSLEAGKYRDAYCNTDKKWVKVAQVITVIPKLLCNAGMQYGIRTINDYNQNVYYWNHRKAMFDASIATCASAPKEQQAACYMQVRQLELQRQQIAVQNMQTQLQSINAVNQSIQIQNMNNNLNNLNNNLNRMYYNY